jgi:hypothetical protein
MRRGSVRLSRRHRAWVYATFALLFLSGALWLVARFGLRGQGEFGETVSPLEPWSLKLHGGAAMLFLVLLGTLLPGHVRRAWNARMSRGPGILLLGLSGVLTLSGYALYYLAGEATRWIVSPLHWVVGLLLPAGLAWHVWEGRRLRRRTRARRRGRSPGRLASGYERGDLQPVTLGAERHRPGAIDDPS